MNNSYVKRPIPILLGVMTLSVWVLAITSSGGFADRLIDSSTGLLAVLCALIAVGRLAQRHLSRWTAFCWWAVLVLALVDACLEFAEPFARLKGHNFALENVDDLLLVAAGPIGLWLTSRLHPRPVTLQLLLVVGLFAQLGGAVLDLSDRSAVGAVGLAPEDVERYADFAQFLSLMLYAMATWLLAGGGSLKTQAREKPLVEAARIAQAVAARRTLRDTLYPPPFVVGWALADPRSPAGRVHRLCNEALWSATDIVGSGRNLGTIALWPLIAMARAVKELRHYGPAVQTLTGKSQVRQFLEQVAIAVLYRISPRYYYVFEFYLPRRWSLATHYLMRYETKEIAYRLLYPVPTVRYEPTPLKNKMEFSRHCRSHGVRCVEVFMLFDGGECLEGRQLLRDLPATDLFIKPVLGKGGGGCELWRRLGDGLYRNSRGMEADAAALMAHVAALSRKQPCMIQRALRNHHELHDLTAGALSTVRLLSCRNEAGDFEATCAAFRMSVNPASPIDNFHAGGVAAAVDLASGCLGPATTLGMGEDFSWYEKHPVTGGRIEGRQLPYWRETLALAERAHRVFPDYVLVGWDIAILEDGPCIIEGNRGPDVDIHQRTARAPIGDGRFGELLAFNLERRARSR